MSVLLWLHNQLYPMPAEALKNSGGEQKKNIGF